MKILARLLPCVGVAFATDAATLCPSDVCWVLNEATKLCELKPGVSPPCFTVTCTTEDMTVNMRHELFGTSDAQDAFDEPGITFSETGYNANTPGYYWTKALGDVPVAVINSPLVDDPDTNAEHVQFKLSATSKPVEGAIPGVITKPRSPLVNWECRYLAKIDIPNFEFNINKATATGASVSYGNFLNGFSLQVFSDSDRTQEVTEDSNFFIGATVYAKTTWTTPVSSLNYFIESCTVTQGTADVKIIKDNCFSRTLGAKRDVSQANYKVDDVSKFEWVSFTTGQAIAENNLETIVCSLQVCTKDSTTCNPKDTCPTDAGYDYTLTGQ